MHNLGQRLLNLVDPPKRNFRIRKIIITIEPYNQKMIIPIEEKESPGISAFKRALLKMANGKELTHDDKLAFESSKIFK